MTDEKALVKSALDGNIEAFEQIVDKYKNKLFSFLVKLTFSQHDAEEILQEVFIRAYHHLDKYNDRWMLSTWLYRIALNAFKSWHRKKKRLQTIPIDEAIAFIPGKNTDNPEAAYEMNEKRREVIGLILELKEKQRIPFILKHVKGLSYNEIGNILGITEEAVKMKVFRAKENICKRYLERHRGDWS